MISKADGSLLASATADLTLTVTQDADNLRADMVFYDVGNDEYYVCITGLDRYDDYHAYMFDNGGMGENHIMENMQTKGG